MPAVKNMQAPRHFGKLIALLRGGGYFQEVRVIRIVENLYTLLYLSGAVESGDRSENFQNK